MDKSVYYDSVIEIEDFLTRETCNKIIELFEKSKNFWWEHHLAVDTKTLVDDVLIKDIVKNVEPIVDTYFLFTKLDVCNINKWPVNSSASSHTDVGDCAAFIIYLNDDYIGGHTVIENFKTIIPKAGKMLIFNNGLWTHNVSTILGKPRYTLAGWYV